MNPRTSLVPSAVAAALVASAGGAEAASVTDLSVTGVVSATADASLTLADPQQDRIFVNDADRAEAVGFDAFPLAATAAAELAPPDQNPFLAASGDATLSVERLVDGVSGTGNLSASGGFTDSDRSDPQRASGEGFAEAAFEYLFELEAAAEYELSLSTRNGFITTSSTSTRIEVALTRLEGLELVAQIDELRVPPDFEADRSLTGTVEPGAYSLTFFAEASVGEFSFDEDFGFRLSLVPTADPIPSPAALPAGLALLGGLLARRRR